MISIETAETPLDFAYCAVRRLPSSQIDLLQEVAHQYANHGATDDTDRAVAILNEVRQEQQLGLRKYENLVVYPRIAADYFRLGRKDTAFDILDETIRRSRSLLVRWKASIYASVAEVCYDIGKYERCDMLLRKVADYVNSVIKFGTSIIETYWLFDLFLLYLRLGMMNDAESLAAKMTGSQRVEALATLAFHGQPDGVCRESLLDTALQHCSESSKAVIASLMIQNGQYDRAAALLKQIVRSAYLRYDPSLEMVLYMLQRSATSGALKLLDQLLETPHAVSTDSDHLASICAILHDEHDNMLHRVLDHVSREVEMNTRKLTRLAGMAKLVGFLAPYSLSSAETALDQLLDSCQTGIDQAERNIEDRVLAALHTVTIGIDKHGLSWSSSRREMFRRILVRISLPRRFEYADLFRAKIADGIPSITVQHSRVG